MSRLPMSRQQAVKLTQAVAGTAALTGFVLALPWLLLACGGDATGTASTTAATCDLSTQPSCPDVSQAPSYQGEVALLFETYCLQCHDPNGVGAITGSSTMPQNPNGRPMNANDKPPYAADGNGTYNANPKNWDASPQRDWSNFKNIQVYKDDILSQVYLCKMPPDGATKMSAADRVTLMTWLKCGAPDN